MPSMDWDDFVESAGKEETPPPANTYVATVETAEWVKTKKAPPRDMLKLRFRIDAGPEKGKALFTQILVDPEAQSFAKRRSLEQLNAIGLSTSDLKNLSDKEQCERVIGNAVTVETSVDSEYDPANPRARVDKILPAPGGPAASSDAPPPRASDAVPPPREASSAPPPPPFE